MAQALVHKQFNSPIGLYSDNNIKETLNRELKTLTNGSVGIDFSNDPVVGGASTGSSKPANLANSAVLRMLEEEEEQRRQGINTGYRTVAWPPPNETHPGSAAAATSEPILNGHQQQPQPQYPPQQQQQQQQQHHQQPLSYQPAQSQTRGISQSRQPQYAQYQPQQQRQPPPQPQYQSYEQLPPVAQQPQQPQQQHQRQPQYRQYSVPAAAPSSSVPAVEVPYQQNYPQGTPVYQSPSSQAINIPVAVERSDSLPGYGSAPISRSYSPARPANHPPMQQQHQFPTRAGYLAPAKPTSSTVSFSGGLAVQKPVQKPNGDYYITQQQRFYNNDDDQTINQPRGGSMQRQQQQQQQQLYQPAPMSNGQPHYNSQSSLPQAGGYPSQGGQGQGQRWAGSTTYGGQPQQQQPGGWSHVAPAHQNQGQHFGAAPVQQQPSYNSNYNNAPSYDPVPQYPAQVSYQSTAYNQPLSPAPAYTPQSPATPQYQQQQQYPAQHQYQQQQSVNSGRGYGQQQPTMSAVSQPQQQQQPVTYRQQSPAGMVTLRQSTPISQKPNPVYQSQPPVSSFKGGANMRGDMKWPPEECKQQTALENEARLRLAAGPACRPRRVNKDYGSFFARHALNSTYPGYRIPPGTQHYPHEEMM